MKHKITSGLLAILGDLNLPIIPQYNRLTFNVGAYVLLKGTLSGLRQFFAAKSPLEMMKNTFYFTSKALFVLKIFKLVFILIVWSFSKTTWLERLD